jgi:YidC/Oxa1 family membrane protein insertase
VNDGPATLTLTGTVRGHPVRLDYTFTPGEYRIAIAGQVGGVSASGGTLVVGMGNGFRDTESNLAENHRESGIVTRMDGTKLTRFSKLTPLQTEVLSGPFDWVAVKSKYFVAGFFAFDSSGSQGIRGLIGGVLARPGDTVPAKPVRARTEVTMPVSSAGAWGAALYLGPMEYDRLASMGHDFDDVNPYGWPGLRAIIRPFAVGIRTVFVWTHQSTGLHYGLVIILFGILIRILLWPLNQKAMRSMTAMQAIQPELQEIQKKYKEDPQRLQQEMMKLYKVNKVNPFGGCWPMLIPYPVLVAVFFVLQNTIELRGVSFLWMPDLARADPLYIIPVVMAISMFGVSKIGQMGIAPNPQAKMMTYVLPVVFGVMFANFASGLNLYYAVQNIASIPQQWMIMHERRRMNLHKRPASS